MTFWYRFSQVVLWKIAVITSVVTLRASCGAVYCNRSCLFVDGRVCVWVCYHDNSKLRASILTKLGLWVKVVTISSWLNFGRPAPPRRGFAVGWNLWLALLQPARSFCLSSKWFFFITICREGRVMRQLLYVILKVQNNIMYLVRLIKNLHILRHIICEAAHTFHFSLTKLCTWCTHSVVKYYIKY